MLVTQSTFSILLGCTLGLLLTACSLIEPDPFEPEVVVESYQIAGERLQPVRLSWSASIREMYDPAGHAITGAAGTIELLDDEGAVEVAFPLVEDGEAPGLYVTRNRDEVLPLRTYRLRIEVPGVDHEIRAETTVPDTFSVVGLSADTLTYQQTRAELTLSRSRYPGRQSVYIFSTTAADVREENLTPFYRSILDASDEGVALKDFRVTSSGALNEANFAGMNGTVRIDVPWLAIAFYGLNHVRIAAIDDAYYNFVRSQQAQQGGFGFAPGEIPNIISNVEGGTGLFGSFASQSVELYVQRPHPIMGGEH